MTNLNKTTDTVYGAKPEVFGVFDLDFYEYMHYLYLPVLMDDDGGLQVDVPKRLAFAEPVLVAAQLEEQRRGNVWNYAYVTARRGFATPGNPLNRPGWHADGFGTEDVNYVWTDRFPTLFAEQSFTGISDGHNASMTQFADQIEVGAIRTYADRTLLRLDQQVIHAAPEIPAPGGERSFFKVSFSNERYALRGNSHNNLLDYDWPMLSRTMERNDPSRGEADAVPS